MCSFGPLTCTQRAQQPPSEGAQENKTFFHSKEFICMYVTVFTRRIRTHNITFIHIWWATIENDVNDAYANRQIIIVICAPRLLLLWCSATLVLPTTIYIYIYCEVWVIKSKREKRSEREREIHKPFSFSDVSFFHLAQNWKHMKRV